jgi:hypothetical protein
MELNKIPVLDVRRLIGHVKIDREVMNIVESFIHERKDSIEKDIVRERKKKAKLLDEKINRLQESNVLDPKIYEDLINEVQEEYNLRPVDTNFSIDEQDIEYFKMLAEYELLKAINEMQILMKEYSLTINTGENDFLSFRQLEIIPSMTLKLQEYQESLNNLEPIPSPLQEDLQKVLEIFARAGQ